MTAPIIPEDLIYPVRGEDRTVFASKANTFNQRLVDELVPKQNELSGWMNTTASDVNANAVAADNSRLLSKLYSESAAEAASGYKASYSFINQVLGDKIIYGSAFDDVDSYDELFAKVYLETATLAEIQFVESVNEKLGLLV